MAIIIYNDRAASSAEYVNSPGASTICVKYKNYYFNN